MGAIGGLLGLAGGAGGSGFDGPVSANILQGVNVGDVRWNYDQSQAGVQQQQQLLEALKGVNGLGSQTGALQAQQSLAQQQQGTAGQYQNLANGVGPNPAQAQFAQNTAANVAQTGALMAGQRGASQNVGLIARQAGQQGAQTQQQAAGQAATLQAQQQIAGLQGLSAQQAQIGNTNQNVAQIAGQQAANQIGQTNAITSAHQANYGNAMNALGAFNNANVGMQSNINNVQGQLANTSIQGQQAMIGGLLNAGAASSIMGGGGGGGGAGAASGGGAGAAIGLAARGGEVTVENDISPNINTPTFGADPAASALSGKKQGGGGGIGKLAMLAFLSDGGEPSAFAGQSDFGKFISGVQTGQPANTSTPTFAGNPVAAELQKGINKFAKKAIGAADNSEKDSNSPTDNNSSTSDYAGPNDISAFGASEAKGGSISKDFRAGGKVRAGAGQKATKSGDNYANDKIPAVLSEHEIVLPRSVTLSDNPVKNAASFVQAVIAKRGRK